MRRACGGASKVYLDGVEIGNVAEILLEGDRPPFHDPSILGLDFEVADRNMLIVYEDDVSSSRHELHGRVIVKYGDEVRYDFVC